MTTTVLLFGCGVVGGALLDQIAALGDERLRICGVVNSTRVLGGEIDPATARSAIRRGWLRSSGDVQGLLDELAASDNPILVDATAADGHERLFAAAIQRGISIVSANKKPFAVRQTLYDVIRPHCRIETTVGAGLPVIETVRSLRRTGDAIHRIEGALSGTLGYLTSELSKGVRLSDAVRRAWELGYTEPRPQEDLSGADVARKALILARECGSRLELSDVVIDPFVPPEFLDIYDVEEFLAALRDYDQEAADRFGGGSTRYLATVTPTCAEVGLVTVDSDHPAAALRGPQALVAFSTARYAQPLVVSGPGAGGTVTAAGVLSDIFRLHGSAPREVREVGLRRPSDIESHDRVDREVGVGGKLGLQASGVGL